MDVLLLRLRDNNLLPTPGLLFVNGRPLFTSLEPANKGNLPLVSCIPAGTYECVLRHNVTIGHKTEAKSKEYVDIYEVTGVPGRSGIYFHIGNFKEDTEGCILVAMKFHSIGIGDSVLGYTSFMTTLEDQQGNQIPKVTLTIRFAR